MTEQGPGIAGIAARLHLAEEVADAIADRQPVVALESTLISHGLPYPANLEVARASEDVVRASGAIPATIAIRNGRFLVGLEPDDLELLAQSADVLKAARPNLAVALVRKGWAATTVSATMIVAHAAGIRVLATGGTGGVHRGALGGARPTFDISSDLGELARTPMAVVCSGPKAILDVAATIENLETNGVPVLVIGSDQVPGFYARNSGVPAPTRVADVTAAAAIVAAHLDLGLGSAVLICVPPPADAALPDDVAREAVERAIRDAGAARVEGPALTPWLLARIAELTDGESVRANTALIVNNAATAAELALRLARSAEAAP